MASETLPSLLPEGEGPGPPTEPSSRALGGELDAISGAFDTAGMAGLIVVEAASLARLEREYGADAHRTVLERVFERVRSHLAPALGSDDRVLLGELGRDEIVALLFRPEAGADLHRRELPALARSLAETLEGASRGLGYPYVRGPLRFAVGRAVVLRDPSLRAVLQIRRARDQALADAALNAQLAARRRRGRFVSLVLSENVKTVFEPIVELASGSVHAYEALVRGPGIGLGSPNELFGVAGENDMLFAFDCLCRKSAFASARELPEGVRLFVNCLPSAIHDPALGAGALRETLRDHRIQPSDVVLEIAERESIDNFSIFRELCDHYRELGFRIALDDVGVGYASLEAVTELSPDYIKVDRAFVHGIHEDPPRREVLVALSGIAHRIGAEIVAEGIEDEAELEVLRELGAPYGQGFHLGRALDFAPKPDEPVRDDCPSRTPALAASGSESEPEA